MVAFHLLGSRSKPNPLLLELSSVAGLQRSRLDMLGMEENNAPAEPGGSLCLIPVLIPIPM